MKMTIRLTSRYTGLSQTNFACIITSTLLMFTTFNAAVAFPGACVDISTLSADSQPKGCSSDESCKCYDNSMAVCKQPEPDSTDHNHTDFHTYIGEGRKQNLVYKIPKLPDNIRLLKVDTFFVLLLNFSNVKHVTHLYLGGYFVFPDNEEENVFQEMTNLTCLFLTLSFPSDFIISLWKIWGFSYTQGESRLQLFEQALAVSSLETLQVDCEFGRDYLQRKPSDSSSGVESEFLNFRPTVKTFNVTCSEFDSQKHNEAATSFSAKTTVYLGRFCYFTALETLLLSHCGIDLIESSCTLFLKTLDLSHNNLTVMPLLCNATSRFPDSYFPELENLILHHNQIYSSEWTDEMSLCLPKLKVLDLRKNELRGVYSAIDYKLSFVNVFSALEVLRLEDQDFYDMKKRFEKAFPLKNFSSDPIFWFQMIELLRKLEPKRFKPNTTQTGTGTEVLLPSTLMFVTLGNHGLDFSDKNYFTDRSFQKCKELRNMNLDGNNFKDVDKSNFLLLFSGLRRLHTLSLRYCDLREIPPDWSSFRELAHLSLEGNSIHVIPIGTFNSLFHLETLDISGNQLLVVGKQTFDDSTIQRLSSLYLGNNSFMCSCDILWLRKLMISAPSKVFKKDEETNKDRYNCRNLFETSILDYDISEQECLFTKQASIAIIVTCSFFIVILCVITVLFRYHWHIRLLFYDLFRGRTNYKLEGRDENEFQYDVFVSYASENLPWVREHVMLELEDRLGLRLCIHERDFIPGQNIVDNIADCVQGSKKILMIFSRDFVLSQWCQFELTFCLSHVMEYDDALIIACIDDVASREVTPAMMALMNTTTYIQWEPHADAVFRERLRLSLRHILHNARQPEQMV